MQAPAPFRSAAPAPCKRAWTGGCGLPPLWAHYHGLDALDTASVHTLVRAAGLPESELRHMGFTLKDLHAALPYVERERAARLLGRIAWDADYGARGCVWADLPLFKSEARLLGDAVVRAWFS